MGVRGAGTPPIGRREEGGGGVGLPAGAERRPGGGRVAQRSRRLFAGMRTRFLSADTPFFFCFRKSGRFCLSFPCARVAAPRKKVHFEEA